MTEIATPSRKHEKYDRLITSGEEASPPHYEPP